MLSPANHTSQVRTRVCHDQQSQQHDHLCGRGRRVPAAQHVLQGGRQVKVVQLLEQHDAHEEHHARRQSQRLWNLQAIQL